MDPHKKPVCPYCNQPAALVTGEKVQPNRPDLHSLYFWQCEPCGAHVGCHRKDVYMHIKGVRVVSDGTLPLGRLADAQLRRAKSAAHDAFDWIWRTGRMKRRAAYAWLAQQLGIDPDDCHIGEFDIATCRRVVDIAIKNWGRV